MPHHKTSITSKQRDAIIRAYIDGDSIPKLAKRYGVDYKTIQRIVQKEMPK